VAALMDSFDFFTRAMQPDFPDEMNFQLQASDPAPDRSLSLEGLDEIAGQIRDFIIARIKGNWDKTGQAPKSLFATVNLSIGKPPYDERTLDVGLPWSNQYDGATEGLRTIDGSLRHDVREQGT
jgi:hypothetical protein